MYKKYIMQKKLGLIAQLLPKIGFKHFTAAYRGSPPPAVFHNQIKKNTAGKSAIYLYISQTPSSVRAPLNQKQSWYLKSFTSTNFLCGSFTEYISPQPRNSEFEISQFFFCKKIVNYNQIRKTKCYIFWKKVNSGELELQSKLVLTDFLLAISDVCGMACETLGPVPCWLGFDLLRPYHPPASVPAASLTILKHSICSASPALCVQIWRTKKIC